MRVLVTGGAGFIGSNFVRHRLGEHPDDELVIIDKLTYASDTENLSGLRYTLIRGDIADAEAVKSATRDVDLIVNFAAESHVDNSIVSSENFVRSNIVGVHNLLEAVRRTGVRFHQISTDEVYGSLPLGSQERFSESSKYDPRNPYSATKAAADFLVRAYYNTYGLPVTISNCSNNYGPNQHPEKLIPKAIINAHLGRPIPVYGNGRQVRDWIFVEDHCSAIDAILQKGRYGRTYLIGVDNEQENISVVRRILSLMGRDESLIRFVEDRPGHDVRYAIDAGGIRGELGWRPAMTFETGLRATVDHYLKYMKRYLMKVNGAMQNVP